MATTACDPCRARSRSTPALFWCPFCREAFCKACCQFHQTMKLTRTHKVRTIAETSTRDREDKTMAPYSFETTLTPATFNEKTHLREIDNVLLQMDGLSDTSLTLKHMYFDLKQRNETEKVECLRKVGRFCEKLKRLADDLEHHIEKEIENLHHVENSQIQLKIEECDNMFNTIELSKDLTQILKTELLNPQTVHKVNVARQRCVEFKSSLQRIHSGMQPVQYNLAIDRNISDALNSTPGLIGKLEVSHESDDLFDECEGKLAVAVGPRAENFSNYSRSTGRTRIMRMNSAHAQKLYEIYSYQKGDLVQPMVTAICVLNNSHILTLDRSNNKVLLVHQNGEIVTQYVFTSQIWGMTLVDSNTAAVTVPDNDKIVLVRVRNKNLCAERLIKTSNICFGVCSIGGFIVVTVKGGYVKILTKAGEEVASVRHNVRGDLLFLDPQHVATNIDRNELYVTDYTMHTVTALFLAGVKINAEPKFVFQNNELRNPTGVCLDSVGNIYVCGFSTHNVLKLSGNGQFLLVLLTGVINPQAVAFSPTEDQLYVSTMSHSSERTTQMQNVIAVFRV